MLTINCYPGHETSCVPVFLSLHKRGILIKIVIKKFYQNATSISQTYLYFKLGHFVKIIYIQI